MAWFSVLGVAFRNVLSRRSSLWLGGSIFFGAFTLTVGMAFLSSVENAAEASLVESFSGAFQLYDAKSREAVSLIPGTSGAAQLLPLDNLDAVTKKLEEVPGVAAVVPMAVDTGDIFNGNPLDRRLERLRKLVTAWDKGDTSLADTIAQHRMQLNAVVKAIQSERATNAEVFDAALHDPRDDDALARALDDGFWQTTPKGMLENLEFLENRVAPMLGEGKQIWLPYIAVPYDAFEQQFPRFEVVKGSPSADGRGIWLSDEFFNTHFKLGIANRLDTIDKALRGGQRLDESEELQTLAKRNRRMVREILVELTPTEEAKLASALQQRLRLPANTTLRAALDILFDVNDDNFRERFELFYSEVAPRLPLFRLEIGQPLVVRGLTAAGELRRVALRFLGTYRFRGMGNASATTDLNLIDLKSHQQLRGYASVEEVAEMKKLLDATGMESLPSKDDLERLMGDAGTIVENVTETDLDVGASTLANSNAGTEKDTRASAPRKALSLAVQLKLGTSPAEVRPLLETAASKLDVPLKVAGWREASGILGDVLSFSRILLLCLSAVGSVLVLVLVETSLIQATLKRVKEVGTLRALGAQRSEVLGLLLSESVLIGIVFSLFGSLAGLGLMQWLSKVGVPAPTEELWLYFGGERLYPTLAADAVGYATLAFTLASIVAGLWPAVMGSRASPLHAMQSH